MQRVGGASGFGWALVIASVALASGALPACGNSEGTKPGASSAGSSSGGSAGGGPANAGASSSGAPASGGSSSSGGSVASGGAVGGGSAATRPDPTTQTGACVLYAERYCQRISACSGLGPRDCLDAFTQCPDAFFSEGSLRTIEGVVACSKEWATFSCERMAKGESPDCIVAGTKASKERCLYASQCSSLSCTHPVLDEEACGVCTPAAALGEDCNSDTGCAGLTSCDIQTGKCKAFVRSRIELGAACEDYTCVAGAYCDASSKCAPYPKPGEPCGKGFFCDLDQYCRSDNTCQKKPAPGMPCGQSKDGYYCDSATADCDLEASGGPTCSSLPKAGEPCASSQRCHAGFFCQVAGVEEVGVCRVFAGKGEACAADMLVSGCAAGLFCDEGKCQSHAAPEEPCSDGNTVCHPNSMCDGKVCVPLGFNDAFAKACKR